jgi:hypothetical protein
MRHNDANFGIGPLGLLALNRRDSSATPIGEMTQLILKRGNTSRPSGQWKDEDYDVLADGKVVGRVQGSRFGPSEP